MPRKTPDEVRVLPLDEIKPYWRNPRNIPASAVDAVADSIERYGYQNRIIVDAENTIITGHTRYAALRQLGWTEAEVRVTNLTAEQARAYRLVDNSTADLTGFAMDKLIMELREITDPEMLNIHFPDIDLSTGFGADLDPVTAEDIAEGQERAIAVTPGTEREPATFICPHCMKSFQVDAADLAQA
jgi:hypothetical protein